jgi:hypothetical protein
MPAGILRGVSELELIPAEPGVVALDEARRALDRQNDDLGKLRDRSMTLLGAGGVAAGLIVGFRPDERGSTVWAGLAVAAFVTTAVVTVGIAWPKRFTFVQSPAKILAYAEQHRPTKDALARRLAEAIEGQYDKNEERLVVLTKTYAVAIAAFVLEIAFLLADLKG